MKLQHELDCLKAEVVNALMGNGKFSAELLSGLIADKEEQIRQEHVQAEALRTELDNRHTAMKSMGDQYTQFEGWAQEFERCSHERKRMIILHLVNRIVVDRDYEITIHLNTAYDQFLEAAA